MASKTEAHQMNGFTVTIKPAGRGTWSWLIVGYSATSGKPYRAEGRERSKQDAVDNADALAKAL